MKALGIIMVAGLLATAAETQTARWIIVGSSGITNLFLDGQSVRLVEYAPPLPSRTGGTRRTTYTEVWIKGEDAGGETVGHYLWTFDCSGHATEMAAIAPKLSHDMAARIHQNGLEPYMIRIPPGSFASAIENRVCKK